MVYFSYPAMKYGLLASFLKFVIAANSTHLRTKSSSTAADVIVEGFRVVFWGYFFFIAMCIAIGLGIILCCVAVGCGIYQCCKRPVRRQINNLHIIQDYGAVKRAPDGNLYTHAEFINHFGPIEGEKTWQSSMPP